ncbi:Transcription factor [Coemansia brasiliensis]|uniref:Transcription factor n=1 Tax=Coemansia brasiliensis TaxID=2650707 RepID=A0A9W8M034_9FUNG|nr:Transcription factor [Coemansia brasiliensis]
MAHHRRKRSKLALEPNPFEESFSLARPTDKTPDSVSQPQHGQQAETPTDKARSARRHSHHEAHAQQIKPRPSSTPVSGRKSESPGQRIKLPPVAAINGPADVGEGGAWGAESLRSGPLSPAMLVGPAEHPRVGRPAARMGVSDPALHTGLTPFLAGEPHPASPLRLHSAVVTPGLQAMIHAAFDGNQIATTPGGSLRLTGRRPLPPPPDSACSAPHDDALSTMAGPPAASSQPASSMSPTAAATAAAAVAAAAAAKPDDKQHSRAQKHPASMPHMQEAHPPPPAQAKRARRSNKSSKTPPRAQSKPAAGEEDDDEKRRQFLERNRVAALKCRQRKKRQLQELQDRHDYMMSENERLRAEYTRMREAALRVRALLAAHSDCSTARANGVYGTDNLPINTPSVSMRPLLLPTIGPENEKAREFIAAIPPASNGVPLHDVDMAANASHVLDSAISPSRDLSAVSANVPSAAVYNNAHAPMSH